MSVSFVSSATHAETAAQATTSLTIPGGSVGDLLIVWATEQATTTFTADNVLPSAPTYTSPNTNVTLAVWAYNLAAGDVGTSLTLRAANSTHRPASGCLVLTSANGIDAESASSGTGTSVDCPAVIPSHDHDAAVTIGVIASAKTRTWTGWAGSTPGPKDGNGAGGSGGVEFACFYDLDVGATSGTSTGTLSQATIPNNNWVGLTLAVIAAAAGGGGGPPPITLAAALTTQSVMAAAVQATSPRALPNLMYAKPNATWGVLKPFNATPGGSWH